MWSQITAHRGVTRFVTLPSARVAVLDIPPAGGPAGDPGDAQRGDTRPGAGRSGDARPRGAGPGAGRARGTALLVPGFTGGKEDFAPILDPLSDAGFRVVALDLPGQHQSPGPADRAAYSPDRLGAVVNELAESLDDDRVYLLGHSFGGLVARAAVLGAPKRYRSLVLLSSGPSAIDGGRRETMARLTPYARGGMPAVYAARLEVYPPDPDAPVELNEFLRERFLASSLDGLFGMSDALLHEPDRVDELRATGVPVLVCFGEDDDAWHPRLQREMAARLDATVVAIPRAAHSPAVEQPEATVAGLVAFWAGGTP